MNQAAEHHQTWQTYTDAWRAATHESRKKALQDSVHPDAEYCDPLTKAHGYASLMDYMSDFQRQVPGGFFKVVSFRSHSQRSVATWHMCSADGEVLGDGLSYGEYGPDGRLVVMTGFFDVMHPSSA